MSLAVILERFKLPCGIVVDVIGFPIGCHAAFGLDDPDLSIFKTNYVIGIEIVATESAAINNAEKLIALVSVFITPFHGVITLAPTFKLNFRNRAVWRE